MKAIEQSDVAAINFAEMRTETSDDHVGDWQFNWPVGTKRTIIARDPQTGGTTFLLQLPAGYFRKEERARSEAGERRFELHSCHEEIFCLRGEIWFGDHYRMKELGYLNHPPRWVHPADQHSSSGVTLLIKNSGPVDFEFVPIPKDWDGKEYCDGVRGTPEDDPNGISSLDVDAMPWRESAGVRTKLLYEYRDGLRTEMLRLPAGWRGTDGSQVQREMLFVLDGTLSIGDKTLSSWGYCSASGSQLVRASTADGATLIRWSRYGTTSGIGNAGRRLS